MTPSDYRTATSHSFSRSTRSETIVTIGLTESEDEQMPRQFAGLARIEGLARIAGLARIVICLAMAISGSSSVMAQSVEKIKLVPHPDALPNIHAPGEVDEPKLVPFIVRDKRSLPGIVVDETAAVLTGSWQYSTHTPPYVGLGYLHDQKKGKGKSSVTFTPDLPGAGCYEVRMSHCYNVRRSTNTPVTIRHAAGKSIIRINQQKAPEHARLFRTLGTFGFRAGKEGWIRISTEGTDGKYVIVDAVQFIPVPDSPNNHGRGRSETAP